MPRRREKVAKMVANALMNKYGDFIVDGCDVKHGVEGDTLNLSIHCAFEGVGPEVAGRANAFLRQIVDLVREMDSAEIGAL